MATINEILQLREPEVKHVAVDLYFSALEKEFMNNGSITKTETQTIDILDRLISQKKVDADAFEGIFTDKYLSHSEFTNHIILFIC